MEQNQQLLETSENVSKINLESELLSWEKPVLYKEDWINTLGGTKPSTHEQIRGCGTGNCGSLLPAN